MSNENAIVVHKRTGHVGAVYDDFLIIWGGYMEKNSLLERGNVPEGNPDENRLQNDNGPSFVNEYHLTSDIWVFNVMGETWNKLRTVGDHPPWSSGSCGLVHENSLYIYGGYQSVEVSDHGNSNRLYCLNLKTREWKLCVPNGTPPLPCDKTVGWVYEHKLYFFGGFGPQEDQEEKIIPYKCQLILDASLNVPYWNRGWNDQLVCYNIKTNSWEWPTTKGSKPSPRAAHSVDINKHKVYIFGGRLLANRMNDMHILDMKTMTWSGNVTKECRILPEGRSWHTFNFISDTMALLYGGFNSESKVLSDSWLFDTNSLTWHYFKDFKEARLWHTSNFIPLTGELVVVGGVINNISDFGIPKVHPKECLFIRLSPKPLFRLCLDVILKFHKELDEHFDILPKDLQIILTKRRHQKERGA